MPSHALKVDFDTDELKVVCVNSPLPSYLFVFLLNKKLKLRLCRSAKDMGDADKNVSYAVYEYHCDVLQNTWRVIEKRCDSSQEQSNKELGLVVCNKLILLIKFCSFTRPPLYQSAAV